MFMVLRPMHCNDNAVPGTGKYFVKYFQMLWQYLNDDKYAVPGTGKYFVLATTPTRLYQFQGYVSSPSERPLLQQVF